MAKHLGTQKSIRFSDEELALLDRMARKHKTIKAAVMAGLEALEAQKEPSNAALLKMLEQRLKASPKC